MNVADEGRLSYIFDFHIPLMSPPFAQGSKLFQALLLLAAAAVLQHQPPLPPSHHHLLTMIEEKDFSRVRPSKTTHTAPTKPSSHASQALDIPEGVLYNSLRIEDADEGWKQCCRGRGEPQLHRG